MPEGSSPYATIAPTSPPLATALSQTGSRLALAVAFALASFIVHLGLTLVWQRLGLFYFNDVLFASDTHNFLESIAHGERSVRTIVPDLRNSVHPYVWFYFSPLVRFIARLAVAMHLYDGNIFDLRMTIGMVVIPFTSALQSFAFAALLFALGFSVPAVAALLLVNLVCFSSLIYGSVPDHFAITNLALTLMLLLAVAVKTRKSYDRRPLWIGLGLFAAGVTITDLAFFGIIHLATRLRATVRGVIRAVLRAGVLTTGLLIFVLTSATIVGDVMDGPPDTTVMRKDFVTRYLQAHVPFSERIERAAKAVENGFVVRAEEIHEKPPAPVAQEYYPVTPPPSGSEPVYPSYTLEAAMNDLDPIHSVLGVLALAMMMVGAGLMIAQRGLSRFVALTSIALMAFNLVFHNLWGDEYLLYSQHWMTPALLLLAGLFYVPTSWRNTSAVVVGLFGLAVGLVNAVALWDLVNRMRVVSGGMFG